MRERGSETDRKDTPTVAVVIPAYNEASNIGLLLDDIFEQETGKGLKLEKVLVISDGSTDETEEMVRERQETGRTLELVVNPRRMGKAVCINLAVKLVESDYMVLIDADVRLAGPLTLERLLEGLTDDVGMAGGVPVPASIPPGFAPAIYICGDILREYIRLELKGSSNIYGAHGRILALSRNLYPGLEIPSIDDGSRVLSTDQFLYYSCIKSGKRFVLRDKARVLFNLPETFDDYLRQTVRFMYSAANTSRYFNDRGLTSEFYVPLGVKLKGMLRLFRRRPFTGLAWVGYRFVARFLYLFERHLMRREVGAAWDVSESTKLGVGRSSAQTGGGAE